ncbi:uncharacterized protein LOC114241425 [Bombyx mandarina]|uniref:Uncharacterized protein LOC114241425 n=1 Tax=Bombyx mandarina TaxID=7092 RepID=A0A6J2JEU9_BOMMA|nr:uncharacterized protein LOC114241425 [Bombyx mandarina]
MSVKVVLSVLFVIVTTANAMGLLGQFLIDVPEQRNDESSRNCLCKGQACVCCVNFNMTFVDVGGPGCVHMKYVSPDEGFMVKISYGKNLIHSSKIQGSNPEPICLQVFDKLAEVCAKFSELAPTSEGIRGCLELEPRIFLVPQIQFPIGCFKSTPQGMEMLPQPAEIDTNKETEEEDEETETEAAETEQESVYQNIVQTLEDGIAFLDTFLNPNKGNSTPAAPSSTVKPDNSAESQNRQSKYFKHPNQL